MAKALAITSIYSDGSSADDEILTFYPTDPATGMSFGPEDGVWVKIRPISQRRYDEAERRHTQKKKDQFAHRTVEDVAYTRLRDDLIQQHVIDWAGIAAKNATTGVWDLLPYSEEMKANLPPGMKGDLVKFALDTQSVEVLTESFRRTS
jgi:hypothetical protein